MPDFLPVYPGATAFGHSRRRAQHIRQALNERARDVYPIGCGLGR